MTLIIMGTDLFAFQINYDLPTAGNPLYNGNISQTLWKMAHTDPTLKSYEYNYDALNRLTDAKDNLDRYNEKTSYDKNGNILTMFRNGNTILNTPSYGIIDNLSYTYDNGNRLLKVEDSSNNSEGFNNGPSGFNTDYSYDINGNIKTDLNKSITDISYNYLNLPMQINIQGSTIDYTYDATGAKQKKVANGIITDYSGGFQYENSDLKFFPQPEGYVKNNSGIYEYIYQYKDHLGNIRLSYNKSLNIIEENNYYPFGLKQKSHLETYNNLGSSTAQKYKFNGKEFQDELGLAMYDYGARNYDPALGRFMNVDRMAEKYESLTPYQYAGNTPTFFIDINGEYIYIYDPSTNEKYRYENGTTQHQIDGKWQTIDASTILSDFVLGTVAGLNSLDNSGKTGAGLISKFSGEGLDVSFKYRALKDGGNEAVFAGAQGLTENTIFFDNKKSQNLFTTNGYLPTENHVAIGHEMAHLTGVRYEDSWLGNFSANNPDGAPSRSEIRASHYENLIRAESGLPLRTHYSALIERTTGNISPNPKTTLIDKAGNSVYYNTPQRRYPGTLPSLINDGINASNGRILTSRFNYNENK